MIVDDLKIYDHTITFYANWDKDSKNVFEFFHAWNQDFIDYDRRVLDLPGKKERTICRKNEKPDTLFKVKMYNTDALFCLISMESFNKKSLKCFWDKDIIVCYNYCYNAVIILLSRFLIDTVGKNECLQKLTGKDKISNIDTHIKREGCFEMNNREWPTKFIFNKNITIAFWSDGTKTFAKYNPDSSTWRDPMIGALICMLKHYTGKGSASRLHDIFNALDEIDAYDIEDYGVTIELKDGRPKKKD